MRSLVTGGAGFLGSHLCDFLASKGHTVYALDNFVTADISNIPKNATLIVDDVDGNAPLPEVDWIFHLASPAAPADIQAYKGTCISANVDGTKRLINHINECGGQLMLISTMKVYGQCHRVEEYIQAKSLAESLCHEHKIARLANIYGPRMRINDSRVVPAFITRALENVPLSLWNGGEQHDSFCYVDDLMPGLVAYMESDIIKPVEFGYHKSTSIKELASLIIELTNSKSTLRFDEQVTVVDQCHQLANLRLAIEKLNWQAKTTLKEGLIKTIKNFKERMYVGKEGKENDLHFSY